MIYPHCLPYINIFEVRQPDCGLERLGISLAFCDLLKCYFIHLKVYTIARAHDYRGPRRLLACGKNHEKDLDWLPYSRTIIPFPNQSLLKRMIVLNAEYDRTEQPLFLNTDYGRMVTELRSMYDKVIQYLVGYMRDARNDIWIIDDDRGTGCPHYMDPDVAIFVRFKRPALPNASFTTVDCKEKNNERLFVKLAYREPFDINNEGTAFESMPAELL